MGILTNARRQLFPASGKVKITEWRSNQFIRAGGNWLNAQLVGN